MYQNLLIVEDGRIFVDIAYRGCGSGCKYCYVSSAAEAQELASYEDLSQLVEYLRTYYHNDNQIFSFCPNTEPFKTQASTERVLFVLRGIQGCRCHIQISTKEYIDDTILNELDFLAKKSAIFINVSMPFLESHKIEPCASDIQRRVSNIERIQRYKFLKCGLYIKPCTKDAVSNIDRYITIIKNAKPDYVCIGVSFDKNTEIPCVTLHHEDKAVEIMATQKELVMELAARIRSSTQCSVVYSSICAIFQTVQCKCSLKLWLYSSELCNACDIYIGRGNPNEFSVSSDKVF